MEQNPEFRAHIARREKVLFAAPVNVYDAKMKPRERMLIITPAKFLICGYDLENESFKLAYEKGKF